MYKPKSIDKATIIYLTDANEIYSLIKNYKTTNSSGPDSLSNNLL